MQEFKCKMIFIIWHDNHILFAIYAPKCLRFRQWRYTCYIQLSSQMYPDSWHIQTTKVHSNYISSGCFCYFQKTWSLSHNISVVLFKNVTFRFLAHLSRRLTRWAYRIGLEPASVCPCVCPLTISNMNISKTRRPIATKFYLKLHWGGGKPALGFGPGWIRTLVSMATDSSHRVIMGKTASPRLLGCFWSDPFHTCR